MKTFREWIKLKEATAAPDPAGANVIGAVVGATNTGGTPNDSDIADKLIKTKPRIAAAMGQNPAFDRLMAIVQKNVKKINPATQNTSALVPGNIASALSSLPGTQA